jgi:hypothetical protein
MSCSGKKVEKRVSQIDSLSAVMEKVDEDLKEVNKDTLQNRFLLLKRTTDSISKHMTEIRTDESWKYICAYTVMKEPLEEISRNYDLYRREIDSTMKQLADLKHDVKSKLLSDNEYKTYFQNECNSVNAVYGKVNENLEELEEQMKTFDTVHPWLVRLLLKNQTAKKVHK